MKFKGIKKLDREVVKPNKTSEKNNMSNKMIFNKNEKDLMCDYENGIVFEIKPDYDYQDWIEKLNFYELFNDEYCNYLFEKWGVSKDVLFNKIKNAKTNDLRLLWLYICKFWDINPYWKDRNLECYE